MGSHYDSVILADGPAGYWPLNETSGTTATDASGNGHNGTYSGGFTLGATGIGDGEPGVTFNGSTGQVLSTYNPTSATMSLEVWVVGYAGNNGRLIADSHTDSDNKGFQLASVIGAPAPMASIVGDFGNGTTSAFAYVAKPGNGTHHVVATYNGTTITVYVDGVAVGTTGSLTGSISAGTATGIGIAYNPSYNGDFYSGTLAKAAVYNYALTPTQIAAHFSAAITPIQAFPPTYLPRKLGPKAVGPTFFAGRVPKLVPSPLNVVPTPAVARALVQPGASLASGAAITATNAVARALVPRGITAGTPPPAPVVTTGSPEALPGLGEQLTGTINPEGAATTYSFQWGTSASYGNTTTVASAGSGSSPVTVNATVTGLTPGTLYHYRLTATNSGGTTNGADQTFYPFVTPAPQTKAVRTWTDQSPFTYCLYDLLSGRFLGTLPFTQVTFGSQLLQPGTFSGTIDVASQAVQNLGPFGLIQEGRTAVLIDYLGSFIWAGIIWTAPYDQDDTKRQVQVTATEIWSWIQNQRVQATDYSAPPYSGITGNSSEMPIWDASLTSVPDGGPGVYDPVLIAWQMLSDALYYVPNANLFGGTGIAANGYTNAAAYLASGTNTPQVDYLAENYPYSSLQQLGSALNQLATLGLGVGFDYGIDVAGSAFGPVTCTINLSYPRRGRAFSQNNLVLDCQRALKFSIPSDGTQTGNTVYEQGANGALSVSQNAQPLNGGYPILERIMSRSNIQSANVMQVLQQTGAADLAIYSYPLFTPTVTTDLFTGPLQLGQFIVGDDVWWRIPATNGVGGMFCPRFPNGLDVEARVIGYSATAADAGTSTLQVTLAEPPSYSVQGPWLP